MPKVFLQLIVLQKAKPIYNGLPNFFSGDTQIILLIYFYITNLYRGKFTLANQVATGIMVWSFTCIACSNSK